MPSRVEASARRLGVTEICARLEWAVIGVGHGKAWRSNIRSHPRNRGGCSSRVVTPAQTELFVRERATVAGRAASDPDIPGTDAQIRVYLGNFVASGVWGRAGRAIASR